jgi:hypothetical protein
MRDLLSMVWAGLVAGIARRCAGMLDAAREWKLISWRATRSAARPGRRLAGQATLLAVELQSQGPQSRFPRRVRC